MEKLKNQLEALSPKKIDGRQYLSYQAVTNTVAAFLFSTDPADQMEAVAYQRVLETADALCRELGYREVVKLTPPDVDFSDMGLYWSNEPTPPLQTDTEPEFFVIHAGSGQVEMLEEGLLLDARLSQLGLEEVTRQHFKIPVTASDATA